MPLSDSTQAILTFISALLIAIGAATYPANPNPNVSLAVAIIGAVGFGIKEALGAKSK